MSTFIIDLQKSCIDRFRKNSTYAKSNPLLLRFLIQVNVVAIVLSKKQFTNCYLRFYMSSTFVDLILFIVIPIYY